MQTIVDNLDTRIEVSGGGLPLLMVHGWKDSLDTFDNLSESLEKDYKIIRLDLPGFGKSQAPSHAWGSSEYADFLSKVMEKIEEPEIYGIVAHSMGARIVINALARKVLAADKLVLIAGAGIPDKNKSSKVAFSALAKVGAFVASILSEGSQKRLRKKLYKLTGSTDYLNAGEMKETLIKLVEEDSREYAPSVHTETLLIYSSNDKLTPPRDGEQYANLISNSKLVIVDKLGHNIHKNDPAKVLELVKEFL